MGGTHRHPAELRHLQAFVAAADERSMTAAARRLHLSQQALSRTVATLEQRLGAELFERTATGLELTAAGEALLPSARRALAAAEDAFAAVADAVAGERAPSLRADISSGGIETGALIVRRLRREHPDIAVRLTEVGVARGLELLRADRLDAVLGLAVPAPADVRVEPVRHERVLIGMAADHPLASSDEVPAAALADVPLLLPAEEAAAEWNAFVEGELRRAGVTPTRYPHVTHGSVAAAEVVREGACVVPTMAWTEPPADLRFRPLHPPSVMTWSLMWRDGAETGPPMRALLDTVHALSSELGWLARSNLTGFLTPGQ